MDGETDIRHISGMNNVVADALFRVEAIASTVDFEALARDQQGYAELHDYIQTRLKIEGVNFRNRHISILQHFRTNCQTVRSNKLTACSVQLCTPISYKSTNNSRASQMKIRFAINRRRLPRLDKKLYSESTDESLNTNKWPIKKIFATIHEVQTCSY